MLVVKHKTNEVQVEKQDYRDYPRFNFKGDFTSLTLLSADEKMGKLLLLYTVFLTKQGREILDKRCNYRFENWKRRSRRANACSSSKTRKGARKDNAVTNGSEGFL